MSQSCSRCKRPLDPGDEFLVPRVIRFTASVAFGFTHAGMWLWQELSLPFCRRCRNLTAALTVLLCLLLLVLGLLALRWLLGFLAKNAP